jgi:hypothetical protein
MITVNMMNKIIAQNSKQVKREIKLTQVLTNPENYNNFISLIAKTFNIKNKNQISLIAVTKDNDEIQINNQSDLEESKNDTNYYDFYLEEKEKNNKDIHNELKQFQSDDESLDNEFNLDLDINIDISDKDIINIYDRKIKAKIEENNENSENDINFNINNYKENLKIKNI